MQDGTDTARGKRPLWPYSEEQSVHSFISYCLLITAISHVHLNLGTHSWAHPRCCCIPGPWPKKDSGPRIPRESRHEWEKFNEAGLRAGDRAEDSWAAFVGDTGDKADMTQSVCVTCPVPHSRTDREEI